MPLALKPRTFSLLLSQHQAKAAVNPINQIWDWNCIGKPILVRFPKQSLVSFFRSQLKTQRGRSMSEWVDYQGGKGPHKTTKKRPRRRMGERKAKEKWQQLCKVFDAMDDWALSPCKGQYYFVAFNSWTVRITHGNQTLLQAQASSGRRMQWPAA